MVQTGKNGMLLSNSGVAADAQFSIAGRIPGRQAGRQGPSDVKPLAVGVPAQLQTMRQQDSGRAT